MAEREQRLAEFAADAATAQTLAGTLDQIVAYARQLVATDHAGITLIRSRDRLQTAAATDPIVDRADALQYQLREGPCVSTATVPGVHVLFSIDLGADARWPRWGPQAAALGLASALSAELRARDRRLGALNLYGCTTRQFSGDDAATAHLFAVHAAAALAGAITETTLQAALESRTRIGQAQGILMERFGLTDEQALAVLRRYSQTTNRKLTSIVDDLLATGHLPPLSPTA